MILHDLATFLRTPRTNTSTISNQILFFTKDKVYQSADKDKAILLD